MSEVNKKLEEIEHELSKQKKQTKRLMKLKKAFDIGKHEVFNENTVIERFEERFQKLEVCFFFL